MSLLQPPVDLPSGRGVDCDAMSAASPRRFRRSMGNRTLIVFFLMFVFFAYLAVRLINVQAWQRERFTRMAWDQHVGVIPLQGLRGRILDTNRRLLAASLPQPSVAVHPRLVRERERAGRELSAILGMPEEKVRASLFGRAPFVWLARKIPEEQAERIRRLELAGVVVVGEESGRRFHPKGSLAAHLLGYTGVDDNGLDGLEGVFDKHLKGTPGVFEAEMERDGEVLPRGWRRHQPAKPGHDLVLTIDERLQFVVERELEAAVRKHRAKGAVCVLLDARNGDVLAMASKPDYPTGKYVGVASSRLRNHAISDSYEPGSTFKVFLAAAALDSGKVRMGQKFFCGDAIQVDGWTICNANDGLGASGAEDLESIITYSFNVGTAAVALHLGKDSWWHYLRAFGFGDATGIELPGEAEGIVPGRKGWANITLATTSFGQGVAVTPLQLCRGMQAIANGGVLMKPRLVKAIVTRDGQVVRTFPSGVGRRVISTQTAATMTRILRNVVTHGTGKRAEIPGCAVAGKTGTAQIVDGGVYAAGRYNASFLGFCPADAPRVVALVKLEEPSDVYWGGVVAAPLFQRIVSQATDILEPRSGKLKKDAEDKTPDGSASGAPKQSPAPAGLATSKTRSKAPAGGPKAGHARAKRANKGSGGRPR